MNNETLNGMDNSWIISQLKRLGQDKVKQIEQLQAKELFNLLDRYGIQSSLPILLEQYNEFRENGCKQVER